jgi:copper(I)-binding protein
MKASLLILMAVITTAFLSFTSARAHDMVVSQAWSRATPKGSQVAGGYLTIENRSGHSDRLLSAISATAGKVEIHTMKLQDGVMTMRLAEDGLRIASDSFLMLAPGSQHLMFIGLREPLKEGMQLPVSLFFERAGTVEAVLDVEGVGAKGPRVNMAEVMASTQASVFPAAVPTNNSDEPFFTHICGARVMANVTVSPGRHGPVEVLVQLEDADEKPLGVNALFVGLSNPDTGIVPVRSLAERVAHDIWRVRMSAATAGKWLLSLSVEIEPNDTIEVAAPILIE